MSEKICKGYLRSICAVIPGSPAIEKFFCFHFIQRYQFQDTPSVPPLAADLESPASLTLGKLTSVALKDIANQEHRLAVVEGKWREKLDFVQCPFCG